MVSETSRCAREMLKIFVHSSLYTSFVRRGREVQICIRSPLQKRLRGVWIGWATSVTPQGELYYVNHVQKTTTWTKPSWNDSDDEEEDRES